MSDTTFDEARRCPKCKELGKDTGSQKASGGSTVHKILCMNDRCKWFGTTYVVQVNADGTIPPPNLHRDKAFPALAPRSDSAVEAQYARLLDDQLTGRGEIAG